MLRGLYGVESDGGEVSGLVRTLLIQKKGKKRKKTCAKATANRGEVTQKLSGEKRNDQIYRPDLGVSALAQ